MLSRTFFIGLAFVALHCGGSMDNPGGGQTNDECKALQQGTSTCSTEGLKCVSPAQACFNQTLYCTCESGHFYCDSPPVQCPEPACPPPEQVKPGAACSYTPGSCPSSTGVTDCDGNFVPDQCSCGTNGFYECATSPMPPCAIDAGAPD